MILISGAGGKTGKMIVSALSLKGLPVRAWVRRDSQRSELLTLGAQEVFVGDITRAEDWKNALEGVEKVYCICPNMSPDEETIGEMAIYAAKEKGIKQFVYHSVLHPQVQEMAHHWAKLRVEERLFKSGLSFTILQPAAYMQNVLAYKNSMLAEGVYSLPYSVTSKSSMIDLGDLGEAVVKVFTEPGHEFAIYELSGRTAYSGEEVAAIISNKTGRHIKAETMDRAIWEKNVRARGLQDYAVQTLLNMFLYYEDYHFIGNGMVLSWLLGREPTSFETFIDREF